ncbi:MAG: lipopolysaccharide biosynthesis protein [Paracoccaceae bacterium]
MARLRLSGGAAAVGPALPPDGRARPRGVKRAHWAMAGQVLTSAANLLTTVLLIRLLGLEGFGQFSLCFLMIMVLRSFFMSVVLAPMSTIAPKLRTSSQRAYLGFLLLLVAGFVVVSSLVVAALLYPLSWMLGAPWLMTLAVPMLVTHAMASGSDFCARLHMVTGNPKRSFGVEWVRYSVQFGVILGIFVQNPSALTPATALYALAIAALAGAMTGMMFTPTPKLSRRLTAALWPRHWNFIRWMSLANIVESVQTMAPMFIGLALLGEAALGVLRPIQQLSNILNLPTNAMHQFLPTTATEAFQKRGVTGLGTTLRTAAGWTLLYFTVVALALMVLSPALSTFIFATPQPGFTSLILIFAAANLFIALRVVFSTAFLCIEEPRQFVLVHGLGMLFAIGISFSASALGPTGIALAVAGSTGAGLLMCLLLVRGKLDG